MRWRGRPAGTASIHGAFAKTTVVVDAAEVDGSATMKWGNIKWAVIASLAWAFLVVGLDCAGCILIACKSLPDEETQAAVYKLTYVLTQSVFYGWIGIWGLWLLARPKRPD